MYTLDEHTEEMNYKTFFIRRSLLYDHCLHFNFSLVNSLFDLVTLHYVQYLFNRDLKWCSTFSKLKTLFLNAWFVAPDLSALAWFLQHAPLLERLFLRVSKVLLYFVHVCPALICLVKYLLASGTQKFSGNGWKFQSIGTTICS